MTSQDEDEIIIDEESGAATRLTVEQRAPLEIRLGTRTEGRITTTVDFEADREAAEVKPTDRVACGRATGDVAGEPHLLVWYSPAPVQIGVDDVDPAVAERLRALGYAW